MLVLASSSPRRHRLLASLRVPFEVVPPDAEESPRPGERPEEFVRRAARDKAAQVRRLRPNSWILAADTEVALGARILGKPRDALHARRMLESLSGREHTVWTGVVLLDPDGTARLDEACASVVRFRELRSEEIDRYVRSGEPLDKAGAYALQGGASEFVLEVRGSRSNVVGLPLGTVRRALEEHGLLDGRTT
ncbi:MAG: Maf-like protein [Candidatus Binatia bacterium]|nr:MAG: Maf-like protein [Candidatus Binatia bacterium]